MSEEDTTFDAMPAFIEVESEVTLHLDYAHNAKVREFMRTIPGKQPAPVKHLLVKVDGSEAWLALGSVRLVSALKSLGQYTGRIDVTAHGDGTGRTWTVAKAGKK